MKKNRERGLTLLEMLVAVGVFSLLMLLVNTILDGGRKQVWVAENKMHLEESVREGLYRMALEVRETAPSRVAIGANGANLTFQIPANVSNSGTITWSPPIVYQVGGNGSQLVRVDSATTQTTILANDVQTVNFATVGNPVTRVTFSVTAQQNTIDGRALTVTSTGEARLRNV